MTRSFVSKVILSLVLVGLLVFFAQTAPAVRFREGIMFLARPFISLSRGVSRFFSIRSGGLFLEEASLLTQENQRLKAALFEKDGARDELLRLRRAFSFSEEEKVTLRGARVLLFERDIGKEFLLVDQGGKAGLKTGNPVVDEFGVLVGVVGEVGERFAKVEIASNPGRTFEVILTPLRIRAVGRGEGGRVFSLELIPFDAPIATGDFFAVSSGPGVRAPLLLGEVARVSSSSRSSFQEARGVLLARPEMLTQVFVIIQ